MVQVENMEFIDFVEEKMVDSTQMLRNIIDNHIIDCFGQQLFNNYKLMAVVN